jgi:hypothetical protein
MWRLVFLSLAVILVAGIGFSLIESGDGHVSAVAPVATPTTDPPEYARAIGPWNWQFPRDYGPHPEFQTEWWYYTGNLSDADGRRFGFEFTVFRRAVNPLTAGSESEWQAGQLYLAHFTVSDIEGEHFFHEERFSQGAAGLAGATVDPRYRVWLEDWQVEARHADATHTQIAADGDGYAIDPALNRSTTGFRTERPQPQRATSPATPAILFALAVGQRALTAEMRRLQSAAIRDIMNFRPAIWGMVATGDDRANPAARWRARPGWLG